MKNVEIISYEELSEIKGDILVNETPVGMYPKSYDTPVNEDIINNFRV